MSRAKKDIPGTLTEDRLKEYEIFRSNLRLLRVSKFHSAEALGKELGMPKHHRISDLEYGRATVPRLDEVKLIAKHFNVSVDDLLFKNAQITFK